MAHTLTHTDIQIHRHTTLREAGGEREREKERGGLLLSCFKFLTHVREKWYLEKKGDSLIFLVVLWSFKRRKGLNMAQVA